MALITIDCW